MPWGFLSQFWEEGLNSVANAEVELVGVAQPSPVPLPIIQVAVATPPQQYWRCYAKVFWRRGYCLGGRVYRQRAG